MKENLANIRAEASHVSTSYDRILKVSWNTATVRDPEVGTRAKRDRLRVWTAEEPNKPRLNVGRMLTNTLKPLTSSLILSVIRWTGWPSDTLNVTYDFLKC